MQPLISRPTSPNRKVFACLLMLLLLPASNLALAEDAGLLDQFAGQWQGQGELFGNEAGFSMSWEPVLAQQFYRLSFQNAIQDEAGQLKPLLSAEAFYKLTGDGRVEGTWLDSRGLTLPLQGNIDADSLIIFWGSPATEQGLTVYQLQEGSQIKVQDFVLKDFQWHQFGQATYQRSE